MSRTRLTTFDIFHYTRNISKSGMGSPCSRKVELLKETCQYLLRGLQLDIAANCSSLQLASYFSEALQFSIGR